MHYLASTVTLPLFLAALLLILCVGEAVVIFYLLGSTKDVPSIKEEKDTRTAVSDDVKNAATEEEDLAVIMSVMCEELNARPEELVFQDIKRVG